MSVQCNSARSVLRCGSAPGARGEPAAEGTWCRCTTAVIPGPGGQVIVVRVEGELDLCTVEHLLTELGSLLALRPAHLIVDLSELRFCSARGLSVLSRAGDTAIGLGIGYAVAGASARLNWVWLKCWTAAERPIGFPTVAEAVLSAMAHQVGSQDRGEPEHLIAAPPRPAVQEVAASRVTAGPAPVALIA